MVERALDIAKIRNERFILESLLCSFETTSKLGCEVYFSHGHGDHRGGGSMSNANSQSHLNAMSDEEIMEFLKQRKIEKQKLAAEKGQQARKELEAYCQKKYGLTLQQIYTASGKTQELKTYKNPNDPDAKPYTYSGRGKVPGWLKGVNGKPRAEYEVKAN